MVFGFFRDRRRKKLLERAIPEHWIDLLDQRFDFFATLDGDERVRFLEHLRVFVWEKEWFGARDFTVTEEMKLIISALAARMGRRMPLSIFDKIKEIVIYPGHYRHREDQHDGVATLGTAHHFGTVVLSWDAVQHGISIPDDGSDTTLHEFAHMLDLTSGEFSGMPVLRDAEDYRAWSRVFTEHFRRLRTDPDSLDVIDTYGATNEAEFFAVATEVFFEKPRALHKHAPRLYAQLAQYYGINPAKRRRK